MIIVLSPAKTLDYDFEANNKHSVPSFLGQSSELIKQLKQKEPKDIASLMGLSDKLASLNYDRYQSWTASKKAHESTSGEESPVTTTTTTCGFAYSKFLSCSWKELSATSLE